MIGKLNSSNKKVTVIGGGISGLIAAYTLDKKGFEVTLLEAGSKLGGLIETVQTPHGQSEKAAHSLLVNSTVKKFFDDVGVGLLPINKNSKARYIFRDTKIRKMPLRPSELLGVVGRVLFKKADVKAERPTLAAWAEQHLGSAALQYLLSPFVLGVYASGAAEIDLELVFPKLKVEPGQTLFGSLRNKKKESSGKKDRSQMMVPSDGMGSVVKKLEERLRSSLGDRLKLNCAFNPIQELSSEENLVFCTPTTITANLIRNVDSKTAEKLDAVRYAPLVTVTVFVRQSGFDKPVRGVGVLIPPVENRNCLGILFNSSSFGNRSRNPDIDSFTVMLGGTLKPDMVKKSDAEIGQLIRQELQAVLGLRRPDAIVETIIHRWEKAIPIYNSDLHYALEAAKTGPLFSKPGYVLFGNYSGQVSIRGMIEDMGQLVL